MWNPVCALALSAALGSGPVYHGGPGAEGVVADFGAGDGACSFAGPNGDQVYPFDAPMPWVHGHFQEIPAYGGYGSFQPYNYKHVLSQSQAAGGWGMPPTMPYSQQYWHPYQPQAAMTAEQAAAAEYAAEMARLRAREDYRTHGYRPAPPASMTSQQAGPVTPASGTMAAPAARRQSAVSRRLEELQRESEASRPATKRRASLLDSFRELSAPR